MGRGWLRAAVAASFVAAAAPFVEATIVEALEVAELVARADRVVEARVAGVEPALDRQGRPATRVGLVVLSSVKGANGSVVECVLPGGTAGGRTLRIAGVPKLEPGEEVVVFLSRESSAGLTLPIGLGQGVYRSVRDPKTGAAHLRADLSGLDLRDRKTGAPVAGAAASVDRAAFLADLRRIAAGR